MEQQYKLSDQMTALEDDIYSMETLHLGTTGIVSNLRKICRTIN